jgi:2-polyprenyl-3-methyl-5-hydroxy-6-metoxy-1,4-benzoquinol methylase
MNEAEAKRWREQGVDEKWPDDVFVEIASRFPDLRWDNPHHHEMRGLLRSLAPGRRVLDAGCSTGPLSEWAAQCGAASVVGVDIGEERLHKARLRASEVSFEAWDLQAPWPVDDDSFDLIVCVEVFEHLRRAGQAHLVEEAARTLSPSGLLLLTTPNAERLFARTKVLEPEDEWTPHAHSHEVSRAELRELLERAGFEAEVGFYRHPKVHRALRLRGLGRLADMVERLPPRRYLGMGLLAIAELSA